MCVYACACAHIPIQGGRSHSIARDECVWCCVCVYVCIRVGMGARLHTYPRKTRSFQKQHPDCASGFHSKWPANACLSYARALWTILTALVIGLVSQDIAPRFTLHCASFDTSYGSFDDAPRTPLYSLKAYQYGIICVHMCYVSICLVCCNMTS